LFCNLEDSTKRARTTQNGPFPSPTTSRVFISQRHLSVSFVFKQMNIVASSTCLVIITYFGFVPRNVLRLRSLFNCCFTDILILYSRRPPLWSLATDTEVRVRFPTLPDFLRSSRSGTGSTQPREYN
jgi:hypothetical protein